MTSIRPLPLDSIQHDADLAAEQDRLVRFAEAGLDDARGRFSWLGVDGTPDHNRPLGLYAVARLVHCFSIEHLLGRPSARDLAQRALDHLVTNFADHTFGGFFAEAGPGGSTRKELYGHAFVLLAAASAQRAGLTDAHTLLTAVRATLDEHFWVEADGAAVESWDRTFAVGEDYRGQNGNMHLAEACLAAFESTGDAIHLDRAERIAQRIVRDEASGHGWRVPEHFDSEWVIDPEYNADAPRDPFRPAGTIPGHGLEWARLVLNLRTLRPEATWTLNAARQLFATAVDDAWNDEQGGFAYTVDFGGRVIDAARMHWTIAEGLGGAVALFRATGEAAYEDWYARFWAYADRWVIDRVGGSWWHELDAHNAPSLATWDGKPDLYHAWQATLYPRIDGNVGIGEAASRGAIRSGSATRATRQEVD